MTIRPILLFPHPLLSEPAKIVSDFGFKLQILIANLTDTMLASPGVGLAAPQIGVLERVAVIDVSRFKKGGGKESKSHGALVIVNPILMEAKGLQNPREGCLSVPDLLGNVQRYQGVTVKCSNEQGGDIVIQAE